MSSIEKLKARLAADGAELMGVTWGPEAVNMSEEDRAKALLRMIEHFDCPRADLIGRLRGRAFLYSDTVSCLSNRTDVRTMKPVELSPEDKRRLREAQELSRLLLDAADMLETTTPEQR